jgi:hypothetical protein
MLLTFILKRSDMRVRLFSFLKMRVWSSMRVIVSEVYGVLIADRAVGYILVVRM